jgi:uncharacterized protein (TIGR02001 family)
MTLKSLLAAAALPLVAIPTAAFAAEDEAAEETAGPVEIDFELGAASDYRFRGLSLSGKDPEVTAELAVSHESGFYVSAWASNVDADFDGKGNDLEVDWTVGMSKDIGPINLDAGAIFYSYLNHSDLNYIELYGGITVPVSDASITLGAAYAPKQQALEDDDGNRLDNTYVYISGELPIKDTPLSLHGTFGIEDGAFGDNKKDWLVGVSYDLGSGITATLDYVDTHRSFSDLGDATAVFTISKAF